ncbi:MAG: Mov34/MPN/PAD-1 family protein [Acidimicrobiales bacterium]
MLVIPGSVVTVVVAHCLDGYPLEACGLLAGDPAGDGAEVARAYPTANQAASARLYTVPPLEFLRADRDAGDAGLELVGVWHSHTHTEAYPSPTDVAQAPDPAWHYVIVSLRDTEPAVRSYRITGGKITEEAVVVTMTT